MPNLGSARQIDAEHSEQPVNVDEARERILAAFHPLPAIEVPILNALGCALAEDVAASIALPPFTNSAMDGFAVRAEDVASASPETPVVLKVLGEAAAGHTPNARLEACTAMRIMTGAPIPEGADAVVRFEETDGGVTPTQNPTVRIYRAARKGENIRPAGEDVPAGERVFAPGTAITPAVIGLLAALGRESIRVHRPPRIAIIATGDEVTEPGTPLEPGRIYDCNSFLLSALVQHSGGQPLLFGIARDALDDVRAKLAAVKDVDLILTSGGVSVGDFDVVKRALCLEGAISLWQVRIRPGKPLAFGHVGGVPLIGLPGNPVAAAVAFAQFVRPAIRKMLGHRHLDLPVVQARIQDRIENRGGRRHFVRVWVEPDGEGRYGARLAGPQGSAVLTSLVRANGLLVIPEDMPVAEPGMVLPVQLFDWDIV
jgi:molybdopterin molybdotransferase